MAKYETAVLKEVIIEAAVQEKQLLLKEYPHLPAEDFFEEEKHWKRTRKGNIQPFGRSDGTQAIFRQGATERTFDFKASGVELRAFVYTNLADEEVIGFKFMVLPSRKIIEVSI